MVLHSSHSGLIMEVRAPSFGVLGVKCLDCAFVSAVSGEDERLLLAPAVPLLLALIRDISQNYVHPASSWARCCTLHILWDDMISSRILGADCAHAPYGLWMQRIFTCVLIELQSCSHTDSIILAF